MAGSIKGITVEIGGNTGPLQKALQEVNKTSRDLQSELKEVNKQLKLDPSNTVLLEQKQKLLAESVMNTQSKLETLKNAEQQVQQQFAKGEVSEENYRALQREIIKTEQNLENLESEAKKANLVLSQDEAVGNLKNMAKAAGVAAAAVGVAATGMGISVMNSADELQRQADVTGLSAERLQELQYAGNNLGVELDTLTGAQAKLTKAMSGARGGDQKWQESVDKTTKEINELVKSGASADDIFKRLSKDGTLSDAWKPDEIKKFAQDLKNGKVSADDLWSALAEGPELADKNSLAFGRLGVKVTDQNGNLRDSKQVFLEAVDALSKIDNETERDALSMQLFGKSAMDLNPLIKAGGEGLKQLTDEAEKNGAVMSNDTVAGLDKLGDTIDNLKSSILASFGEKLAVIVPKIQELIDKLMNLPQWIHQNSTLLELLGVVIGTVTLLIIAFNIQQALLASGMTLWEAIAAGATAVTTSLGVAFAFLTSPIGLVILAIGAVIAIGILLYKNWDTVKEKAVSIFGAIGDFIGGIVDGIKGAFKGMVNGVISGLNFMIRALNKLHFTVPDWVPIIHGASFGFDLPEIPSFSVGTRYLPEDMLIQAHEGEMIVPKNENPYANSGGKVLPQESSGPLEVYVLLNDDVLVKHVEPKMNTVQGGKLIIDARGQGIK